MFLSAIEGLFTITVIAFESDCILLGRQYIAVCITLKNEVYVDIRQVSFELFTFLITKNLLKTVSLSMKCY